jgi:M6 family metalloprotease-like protein
MVEDALNLVDPLVDFGQFDDDGDGYIDAIDIIHSGYGAETGGGGGDWIWSHRWSLWALPGGEWTSDEGVKVYDYHTEPALWGQSGTAIVRFGVIAHETGHFFGLPDLYDTDQSGEGIGSWGIMANSWGFDYSQLHPPHFCAWSKIFLGWVTPTVISTNGLYTIDQVETNPQIYRIDNGYPSGEYLLIENRQPVGIETVVPQGGLCIYHIDDTTTDYNTEGYPGQAGWPENGNHYRVAVLQADGAYDLENNRDRGDRYDVYRGGGVSEIGPGPGNHPNTDAYQDGNIIITDNRIHSISASAASMSFIFGELTIPQPPVAADVNEVTQPDTPVTITLDATDDGLPNPPNALSYILTTLPNHGLLFDPNDPNTVISSVPYTLSGDEVIYTPRLGCDASAVFTYFANDGGTAPDGGNSNDAQVHIDIVIEQIVYTANMDTDPGWIYEDDWAWGVPQGAGGAQGSPDPNSGYTGANVIGYDLTGDYRKIRNTEWVTTHAIDCGGQTGVTLSFFRWLNVEGPVYDHAYVQVSNDNANWTTIWENAAEITDSSWIPQSFDISAIADNQSTVYVRWGMGVTDNFWHYSGWNIDDVELTGFSAVPFQPITGDFEPDCDVDADDLALLIYYWLAACGDCEGTDLIADGVVNLADFGVLADNWLAGL